MRQKIVAGNWKMNMDLASGTALVDAVMSRLDETRTERTEIVLCPPFILLEAANRRLTGTGVALGAQNLHHEASGAYTGEISAAMLRSVGCSHVIVGHSERRTLFGETDDVVARKATAAIAARLIPIVCVGETLAERDAGEVRDVVGRQVDALLAVLEPDVSPLTFVVAYEPVWAIGTGRTASPEQAQEVHAYIRERLGCALAPEIATRVRVLYGGSVNAGNAAELFQQPDIDGGLIGGASLKADDFLTIVRAAG